MWLGDLGEPSVWLTLSSDINVAVGVQFGSNPAQKVFKKKGLLSVNPREVLTPFYTYGDRPVYYVDDGKSANGYPR